MKLHIFNPENDLALANFDVNFIPPQSAKIMAEDLSTLPIWWAKNGDCIKTNQMQRAIQWQQDFLDLCPQVHWIDAEKMPDIEEIMPWGWSPMLIKQMQRRGVNNNLLPNQQKILDYKELSGRHWAVKILQELNSLNILATENGLYPVGTALIGESFVCKDETQIRQALDRYKKSILKAPWSGSGKGIRLGYKEYLPPLSGWCARLLREQGFVVIEPFYDKVEDLAMEFYSDGNGRVRYEGLSLFDTTHQGAYKGNLIASEETKEKHLSTLICRSVWTQVREYLLQRFTDLLGHTYRGYLGVDMMVCKDTQGKEYTYKLHPCVEINLRMTMGMVAVKLQNYLAPNAKGRFTVDFCSKPDMLFQEHEAQKKENPPYTKQGLIKEGYWNLTPVYPDTHYRASLQIL